MSRALRPVRFAVPAAGRQRCVYFGHRMRRTTTRVLAVRVTSEFAECSFVGTKLIYESSDHHRCIEQREHSAAMVGAAHTSCLAFGANELTYVHRGAFGAVMNENALFADKRRFSIGPAKGDPVGDGFDLEFTPGSQVELLP